MDNTCYLAFLPYELRQRIFRYALQQPGTVGLQTPVWDDGSTFTQPLFAVCKTFRDEGLEAFYKTNSFLWHVNRTEKGPDARPDSDPSQYPLEAAVPAAMTGSLPWHYPPLLKDLRYLVLNVYLPAAHQGEVSNFPQELERVITALGGGDKLKELLVTIAPRERNPAIFLADSHKNALRILGRMRVHGRVKVRARGFHAQSAQNVNALRLGELIKA